MSRLGKKPVALPDKVKVDFAGPKMTITGPKGALHFDLPQPISASIEGQELVFTRADDDPPTKALHGLSRALAANMVVGVTAGYERKLEVHGTGYGCKLQGNKLLLNCGFMGRGYGKTAQFIIDIPDGLQVTVEAENARGENDPARFTIKGIDKQQVNQFAAEIRKIRKPEPYKGKGIRYSGEVVRRKAGKVFAGGG